MVRIDTRGSIDLQTIVAGASVLKQTIHGVQDIMGKMEKPLSGTLQGKKLKNSDDPITRLQLSIHIQVFCFNTFVIPVNTQPIL